MRHALDEIARTTGEKVDLDRIPLDDEPTFELIRASDTLGCFQIESPGQRELLQKLQPTRWEDLIVDISLFRPGPVKSDMIRPYLRRRDRDGAPRLHPPRSAPGAAGDLRRDRLPRAGDPDARRARRLRPDLRRSRPPAPRRRGHAPGVRADFLERATARGRRSGEAAEQTWDAVAQFASFGFCKAHAAAFAVPTYQSAWLKTHYPAHFLAGILTHDPGMYPAAAAPRRRPARTASRSSRSTCNRSEPDYVVEDGPLPTDVARGSPALGCCRTSHGDPRPRRRGDAARRPDPVDPATRAERPFRDVGDFLRRTTVSRPVTEALAHAGAFDALRGANAGGPTCTRR